MPPSSTVQETIDSKAMSPSTQAESCLLVYALVPAQVFVGKHLATYKEFPPRQKAGTFGLDQVLEKLQQNSGSN